MTKPTKTPSMIAEPALVMVRWRDHHSHRSHEEESTRQEWVGLEQDERHGIVFVSVGWLLHRDARAVVVAGRQRVDADLTFPLFTDVATILVPCILTITTLREAKT